MNKVTITKYKCSVCGALYDSESEALKCEPRPITQDKGVKIGDNVIITSGDGAGAEAKVTNISVIDKQWGHYAWERYWHTVAVSADIIGSHGSRFLTFDSYKPAKQ